MKSLTEIEIREILQAGKDAYDPNKTLVGNMSPYPPRSLEAELFNLAYYQLSLCDLTTDLREGLRRRSEILGRFQGMADTLREVLLLLEMAAQDNGDRLG